MTAACLCIVVQESAVVDFTKGSRADFSHRTSIWPVATLTRFLSILRIPQNFFLMSLSFTLFSQAIWGYILEDRAIFSCCYILHVLFPRFFVECLSISFFYPIPSLLFSHFLHLSFLSALVSLLFLASSVLPLSSHPSLSFSQTVCLASLLSRRLLCLQAKNIACICVIRGRKLECLGVEWKVLFWVI